MPPAFDTVEAMRQRASWRNYLPRPLAAAPRAVLTDFCSHLVPPPFPARWRFRLLDVPANDAARARQLGTYGNIAGAQTFIVGAVQAGAQDLEAYGFLLEQVILFATSLNLGTCWLGGSFNRSGFGTAFGVTEQERMPAVTPVGEVASQRGVVDRFLRATVNSRNRKPWESLFFDGDCLTPLTPQRAGAYATALEMVRIGPSASNRQPWRVSKAADRPIFHFFLRRSQYYTALSKAIFHAADLQRIDLGIALCHFQFAAAASGLSGRWESSPPADLTVPEHTEYCATWRGD